MADGDVDFDSSGGGYFDPQPSSNLPEDDPMRAWAKQVQSDPELSRLMATDPQGAMNRMRDLGIPPPPEGFSAYTDGLGKDNPVPRTPGQMQLSGQGGTFGGAPPAAAPYPAAGDPMTAGTPPPSLAERAKNAVTGMFPTFGSNGKLQGNITSSQGEPPASAGVDLAEQPSPSTGVPLPRRNPNTPEPNYLDPEPQPTVAQEENTNKNTDVSAQKKSSAADKLSEFGKTLQGIKPPPVVPPQKISSPNAPSHAPIQAQQLPALLSLIGQSASPIGMTLGRLLATGKA